MGDDERPPLPRLVGAAEIADMLNIGKRRCTEVRRHPDFPAPALTLAMGPLWYADDVERFAVDFTARQTRYAPTSGPKQHQP